MKHSKTKKDKPPPEVLAKFKPQSRVLHKYNKTLAPRDSSPSFLSFAETFPLEEEPVPKKQNLGSSNPQTPLIRHDSEDPFFSHPSPYGSEGDILTDISADEEDDPATAKEDTKSNAHRKNRKLLFSHPIFDIANYARIRHNRSRFWRLPRSVRNHIYLLMLPTPERAYLIPPRKNPINPPQTITDISPLLVSKRFMYEYLPIFYGANVFKLCLPQDKLPLQDPLIHSHLHRIRKLWLRIEALSTEFAAPTSVFDPATTAMATTTFTSGTGLPMPTDFFLNCDSSSSNNNNNSFDSGWEVPAITLPAQLTLYTSSAVKALATALAYRNGAHELRWLQIETVRNRDAPPQDWRSLLKPLARIRGVDNVRVNGKCDPRTRDYLEDMMSRDERWPYQSLAEWKEETMDGEMTRTRVRRANAEGSRMDLFEEKMPVEAAAEFSFPGDHQLPHQLQYPYPHPYPVPSSRVSQSQLQSRPQSRSRRGPVVRRIVGNADAHPFF